MKQLRLILVIVSSFGLMGCTLKMTYNLLDWFIPYYANDYIELDSSQQDRFEAHLGQALQQHRETGLPDIVDHVKDLKSEAKDTLTYGQISTFHRQFTELAQRQATLFVPAIVDTLQQMSATQIEDMNTVIQIKMAELLEKRLVQTEEEKYSKRKKRLFKVAKRWIGSLSSEQTQMLGEMATYQLELEPVLLENQDALFKDWVTLTKLNDSDDFEERVHTYLHRLIALEYPPKQAEIDRYLARRFELLWRLNSTLTINQREHFQGELSLLIATLESLHQ